MPARAAIHASGDAGGKAASEHAVEAAGPRCAMHCGLVRLCRRAEVACQVVISAGRGPAEMCFITGWIPALAAMTMRALFEPLPE